MDDPPKSNPFQSPEGIDQDLSERAVLRWAQLSWILPTIGSTSYLLLMVLALLGLSSRGIAILLFTTLATALGGATFTSYAVLKREAVPSAWPIAQWGIMANLVLWLLILAGCLGLASM